MLHRPPGTSGVIRGARRGHGAVQGPHGGRRLRGGAVCGSRGHCFTVLPGSRFSAGARLLARADRAVCPLLVLHIAEVAGQSACALQYNAGLTGIGACQHPTTATTTTTTTTTTTATTGHGLVEEKRGFEAEKWFVYLKSASGIGPLR